MNSVTWQKDGRWIWAHDDDEGRVSVLMAGRNLPDAIPDGILAEAAEFLNRGNATIVESGRIEKMSVLYVKLAPALTEKEINCDHGDMEECGDGLMKCPACQLVYRPEPS